MKPFLFVVMFVLTTVAGCQKSGADQRLLPDGTKFNLKGITTSSLAKNGVVPTEPFTVDSLYVQSNTSMNYYYCHSANGLIYQIPDNDCDPL